MTYMQAALTVLAYADRPLSVPEITAVAVAQGLVRPRGRTPDRTMASVLYRRMANDPDAPIVSRGGRMWLRARPLPEQERAFHALRARRSRVAGRRRLGAPHAAPVHRASSLPAPPLQLPDEVLGASWSAAGRAAADYAPVRRERAIARAGQRAEPLLTRLAARREHAQGYDALRTYRSVVAPLVRRLGYRPERDIAPLDGHTRRAVSHLLSVDGVATIALGVLRLSHDLGDDDAWRALAAAQEAGAPYGAVTNGRELRLYADSIAAAQDDLSAALVLTLDVAPAPPGSPERDEQAAALWLLSYATVAEGALDAYVADRAVGLALVEALDAPDSPLARALVQDVRARTGLSLPSGLVLRHARLVLRGRRGRDGEPSPEDVAAIAAVRGPSFDVAVVERPRSA